MYAGKNGAQEATAKGVVVKASASTSFKLNHKYNLHISQLLDVLSDVLLNFHNANKF
jgi:hypothetical protein